MTVSDNTTQAVGFGDFFKNHGIKGFSSFKKSTKTVLKNPGRTSEIGANHASVIASRSPKAALSTLPEVINFYYTGKRLYFQKFV